MKVFGLASIPNNHMINNV